MEDNIKNFAIRTSTPVAKKLGARLVLISAAILLFIIGSSSAFGSKSGTGLQILWNGLRINADHAAVLVVPGSEQVLSFWSKDAAADVTAISCDAPGACEVRANNIIWSVPAESGNVWLDAEFEVTREGAAPSKVNVRLAGLVGYSSSLLKNGSINGFRLGEYPNWREMENKELYMPPPYFYVLDKSVLGWHLSENIKLGDLGYDGRSGFPQYFALDYDLVRKLEALKSELDSMGLPSRYHYIGGGFISPKSNAQRTRRNSAAANLSRHMWGEAIDFIIDESPRDQIMDDLNEDGIIDVRDALFIRDLVTELEESGSVEPGGVGVYSPPRNSQVQLHVDVRGFPTRWGYKDYDPAVFAGVPPKKGMRPGG